MGNALCGPFYICNDRGLSHCDASSGIPPLTFDGLHVQAKVIEVYDGDTLTAVFRFRGELNAFHIRLLGYDAPEMRNNKNNNEEQKRLAISAKHELEQLTLNKMVTLHCKKFDPHGRILAFVFVKRQRPSRRTCFLWPFLSCACGTSSSSSLLLVNDFMLNTVAGCVVYGGGNKDDARRLCNDHVDGVHINTLDCAEKHCDCQTGCESLHCGCRKRNQPCTPYCHLGQSCTNTIIKKI